MDKAALIDRVKKCLALGQSCEPHEAAQGLKMAQVLMKKYGITTEDVAFSEVKENATHVNDTLKAPTHLKYLVAMIRSAFGCDAIFRPMTEGFSSKKSVSVSFVGFDPNPQLATYAFEVLRSKLMEGRVTFLKSLHKNCKKATKTRRANLWAEAWVCAVSSQVSKLTLPRDQEQILEKWVAKNFKNIKKSTPKETRIKNSRGDVKALCAGALAGSNVSLYHPMSGEKGTQGHLPFNSDSIK